MNLHTSTSPSPIPVGRLHTPAAPAGNRATHPVVSCLLIVPRPAEFPQNHRDTGEQAAGRFQHRPDAAIAINAIGKEGRMARQTPETTHTIYAISDVRRALVMLADGDPTNDPAPADALLLLDTAAYRAQRADWQRRARNSVEDHGAVNPRLLREYDELEREYAHVRKAA